MRENRRQTKEMFVPLSHAPGQAQCDFGEALVVIGGVERKAHCFVLDLPHSDGCFVKAYPAESTEAFLDGHVSALSFLGGVPRSILYDNTRLAVAKILGDGRRQRTRSFTELQSHYLFEDRFGRPGKGNYKGKVEGLVGYSRSNFLVPVPPFESFEALNAYLERRCLERMDAKLRGHTETIGQRMERDLDALPPLPPAAYDACEKQAGRVSSLSLVRYKTNDYSVPVAYGYRDVLVKGYVDEVVISCGSEVIARHPRSLYPCENQFTHMYRGAQTVHERPHSWRDEWANRARILQRAKLTHGSVGTRMSPSGLRDRDGSFPRDRG